MSKGERIPCGDALGKIQPLLDFLGGRATIAGSLRRGKDRVRDADIVHTGELPTQEDLEKVPGLEWVQGAEKKARVTVDGFQVDLVRTDVDSFGSTLLYLTGPHTFNVKMRSWAKGKGFKLSEKGLFNRDDDTRIAGQTEMEVFKALGLAYTSPAGREDLKCFRGRVKWECEIVGSKGDIYRAWLGEDDHWTCEVKETGKLCRGFQFHHDCKHLKAARAKHEEWRSLVDSHYSRGPEFTNLSWDRPLGRPQAELVAARTTTLNECFY